MTEHSPLVAEADLGGDAYEIVNPDSQSGLLFVCDHASNRVPPDVCGGNLGLGEHDMRRHIAWDVGARGITLALARRFAATAILSRFSRLVVDPNRGEDDPTLVMRLCDGSVVPGNRYIDEAEIERRLARYYRPYHDAVTHQLDRILAAGKTPLLFSIHSFTRQFNGRQPRPWHVGVLWDRDGRLAVPLLDALREDSTLCVGDNEPYSGQLQGDSMYTHGTLRGIPHALIEIRNDLIADTEGEIQWAGRLAPAIARVMESVKTQGKQHGRSDPA
ncbi:MAG: N-formylglutamate amidohydrolase [Paracoccaceae bacterium]